MLIIDKMNIIDLKLSILIDKKQQKAKNINLYLITIFNKLFFIIQMRDFYQFVLVLEKVL